MNVLSELTKFRVVPVVVLDNLSYATPLADALVGGGLGCAEVTLRTAASFEVIAVMAARGDMLVGAGTVLTTDQVDEAHEAGAHFLVSPCLDRDVVAHAQSLEMPILPGVATATDIQAALRLGLSHLKYFPAVPAGGVDIINALHGPFPTVRFMPTGGITLSTLDEFIRHPAIFAVGGSWMVPRSLLDTGDFAGVRRLTQDTVSHLATLTSS